MSFSSRQRAVLAALLTGLTQAQAAETANVSERTVRRYLQNPEFVLALKKAQDAALSGTVLRMTTHAGEALDCLLAVMSDEGMPSGVRVRAALGWLSALWKAKELAELTERVARLEETGDNK